jgi:hypothetical protein
MPHDVIRLRIEPFSHQHPGGITERLARNTNDAAILRGSNSPWHKACGASVQLPTKFFMALNAKTAKALGLTVPQSILLCADEVIE